VLLHAFMTFTGPIHTWKIIIPNIASNCGRFRKIPLVISLLF